VLIDGLRLDDAGAARVRAAHERFVYLKQRQVLTAHPASGDELHAGTHLLMWVEGVLTAIMNART
jgi:hypothetical protein